MKNWIKGIFGLIFFLIILAIIAFFVLWSKVPNMIANNLAKKCKVAVSIQDMSLGPNRIEIDQVEIGNPSGSYLAKAFSCQEIQILSSFFNYFKKDVVIDEIDVDEIYLGLEFNSPSSTTGNWTTIMKNLKNASSSDPSPDKGAKRTVLIKKLVFTNISTDVTYRDRGGKVIHLPVIKQMVLTNISSEGGLPTDQIMQSVLGQMLKSVFLKQNLNDMLQELLGPQKGQLNQFLQPFKNLLPLREKPCLSKPIALSDCPSKN